MISPSTLANLIDRYYLGTRGQSLCPIRLSGFGKCPRALYHELIGAERKPFDARALRIFEMGHDRGRSLGQAITAALQTAIPGAEFVETEREVLLPIALRADEANYFVTRMAEIYGPKDLPVSAAGQALRIRGRTDVVAMVSGSECVKVEIKTKGGYGFDKLDAEGVGFEYAMQALAYTEALACEGVKVISDLFLFENKDTSEIKVIRFDADEWMARYVDQKAAITDTIRCAINSLQLSPEERLIVNPSMPVALYTEGVIPGEKLPWQCNYCSIGPERGKCVPGHTLKQEKPYKAGGQPRWVVQA